MKFASKKKLSKFLEMTNQALDPEDFDFTPYGQQDPEPPSAEVPGERAGVPFVSSHQHIEDQYMFPQIQNTPPACSHRSDQLHVHGNAANCFVIENNPRSIAKQLVFELPEPQVLNLSLHPTIPHPVFFSETETHSVLEGGGGGGGGVCTHSVLEGGGEDSARAQMLAAAINAAARDDPGERLASTSSMLASNIVTSEQSFDNFNATYMATTSSFLPNFDLI